MIDKFKPGDRVIILNKSWWGSLDNSNIYKKGKKLGYWYFVEYTGDYSNGQKVCVVDWHRTGSDGDYFLESDIEFYIEKIMDEFEI